jgi:adenylate cyclase
MAEERTHRRLAAIMAADVAGYARLMAADEAGTLARLKRLRAQVIEPKVAQFQGHIVGSAGDSLLVEFASAINAVQCAVEVQLGLAGENASLLESERMVFRMGVNIGDIIVADDTIHGDGVNIAARLEKLAEPGSVCIGRNVYDQVKGKLDYAFTDLGNQRMHNIPEPVRAYRVKPLAPDATGSPTRELPPLPDKPSIAVLPFQNISHDPEQEYFADGMAEEIITGLSRLHWLFVIARNSSFTYKGRAVDVKQVGRELGVRYLLEGSVRKAGNKVRITGQLIDTSTGGHLWADRFDGDLENIFDLQDQVTANVVIAIAPKVEQAEIERAKRKPTDSLDAYDYYLRGLAAVHLWTREANSEALSLLRKAIELDQGFASAYGMAARCYSQRMTSGWMIDRTAEIAEAERLARRAAVLGRDDALALCTAGFALAYVVGKIEDGAALIDKALQLNPNSAWAWYFSSWVKVWLGDGDTALQRVTRAMRLSPNDPHLFNMQSAAAYGNFLMGRYAESKAWAQAALHERPGHVSALRTLAASCAFSGLQAEAEEAMAHLRALHPALRISNLRQIIPLQRSEDFAALADGLRKAGLPE